MEKQNEHKTIQNTKNKRKTLVEIGIEMWHVVCRIFVTLWIYSTMVVCLLLAFVTQILLCLGFAPCIILHKKFRYIILGRTFRFYCACAAFYLNPFWHYIVLRRPARDYRPSKTILMCNHISSADPWLLAAAIFPWEMKFVFKANLLKVPIAGWSVKLAGDLPVYFTKEKGGWGTKPGSVSKLMESCRDMIRLNIGVVVFPEGTRSTTGRLQPFKNGFFKFALQNQCEILPCAVHRSSSLWPLNATLMNAGTAYISFGDPIIPNEQMSVEILKAKVHESIFDLIKLSPYFDETMEQPLSAQASHRGQGL